MNFVDWNIILMHWRNWHHIPHNAVIRHAESSVLHCAVGIPQKVRLVKVDQWGDPVVTEWEFDYETIDLKHYAWRFEGEPYHFYAGYGPRSNMLVWREA